MGPSFSDQSRSIWWDSAKKNLVHQTFPGSIVGTKSVYHVLGRRKVWWLSRRPPPYLFFFFFLRPTHIYLLRILNIQRMKHAPISVFSFINFSEWKGESRRDVFNIANSLPVVFGRYVHVSLSLSSSSSYLWFFWSRNRRKWEGSSFVMNFNIFCLEFHGFLIVFERFDVFFFLGKLGRTMSMQMLRIEKVSEVMLI